MYLSYYKLNKKPFQISTDPKFLWLGKKHQQALSILKYGIEDDKGFLLLTGDVGTGKTTLINAFVNSLEEDIIVARISDPGLTKLDFIKHVAEKFRMETNFETKSEFLTLLTAFLEQAEQNKKKVLLIIDEAQHLTDEILEEIRLLSNIENQDKKLLNIFLVGQNEFNAALEKYKNRALRQRISINYTLYPLEPEETKTCIEYRLGVAGCQKEIFTPEAIEVIHTLSEGFPRVINIICDHALFQGCQEEQEQISDEMVWKISKDLRFAHIPPTHQEPDFSDPTDDDWLEASEVQPLSIEEINKASQPLPNIAPEISEEQGRKSHKYRVAIPVFIIAFLLSGFFVLDESKIESITQFFADRFRKTIASPLEEKTIEHSSQSQVPPQQSEEIRYSEEAKVGESSAEAPSTITSLNDQKKSRPKNPEPDTSQIMLDDSIPEHTEDTATTDNNQIEVLSTHESDKHSDIVQEDPEITKEQPLEVVAPEFSQIVDIPNSTDNRTVNETIATEIESTVSGNKEEEPTISDSPHTNITSSEEEPTDKLQETAQGSQIIEQQPLPSPAETPVQSEIDPRTQNEVSLTRPEQQIKLGAELTPETLETIQVEVTQQQSQSTTLEIIVPGNNDATATELQPSPSVTQPQLQEKLQAPPAEDILKGVQEDEKEAQITVTESPIHIVENLAVKEEVPSITLAEAISQEIEIPPSEDAPQETAEPSKVEDPGAVIDWLLESNKN